MPERPRNVGASVRQRLLNLAHERGQPMESLLTRYALERLLHRLSVSRHRERFVLKGAMLLTTWFDEPHRATCDLDLLGFGHPADHALLDTFREIMAVAVDDGVSFDLEGLRIEAWDLTTTPIDMLVGFSHLDVGREVAGFLHAKGRRNLAVVAGDDERSRRRHGAFCAAAHALGLPEVQVIVVPAPTTLRSGRAALSELMLRPGGVDAVFCSSDLLALGVLTEAQARSIPVPQQLGIVGFGDLEFAADLNPALTTVRIDGASIGRQAAQFICDRSEGRTVAQRVVDIGFSILDRGSVRSG